MTQKNLWLSCRLDSLIQTLQTAGWRRLILGVGGIGMFCLLDFSIAAEKPFARGASSRLSEQPLPSVSKEPPSSGQQANSLQKGVSKKAWAVNASIPDLVLGSPQAPLTIIEYSSLSCYHCAVFHREVLPKIKKKYIDTGLVNLHYRHFPIDPASVKAYAIFMCVSPERQWKVLEAIYIWQKEWMGQNFLEKLSEICGISLQEAKSCLSNQNLENAILMKRIQAEQVLPNINATPFFIIGHQMIPESPTFEKLDRLLADLVQKKP